MKHKYQSSLSRRLAASGFAAVFGAGAFSSYVGAMNEFDSELIQNFPDVNSQVVPKTVMPLNKEQIIPNLEVEEPKVGVEFNIYGKVFKFKNIPRDQISSDFNKYIEDNLKAAGNDKEAKDKIVEDTVNITKGLFIFIYFTAQDTI